MQPCDDVKLHKAGYLNQKEWRWCYYTVLTTARSRDLALLRSKYRYRLDITLDKWQSLPLTPTVVVPFLTASTKQTMTENFYTWHQCILLHWTKYCKTRHHHRNKNNIINRKKIIWWNDCKGLKGVLHLKEMAIGREDGDGTVVTPSHPVTARLNPR